MLLRRANFQASKSFQASTVVRQGQVSSEVGTPGEDCLLLAAPDAQSFSLVIRALSEKYPPARCVLRPSSSVPYSPPALHPTLNHTPYTLNPNP